MRGTPVIGLPGNPVSAMVCSELFIRPAIAKMLGCSLLQQTRPAVLGESLPANGKRQDFVRARIEIRQGRTIATPFRLQDSSTQKIYAQSQALIIRRPDAPAAQAGDSIDVLLLDD
jgi:molybdopterin molybdotransferase